MFPNMEVLQLTQYGFNEKEALFLFENPLTEAGKKGMIGTNIPF